MAQKANDFYRRFGREVYRVNKKAKRLVKQKGYLEIDW